VDGDQGPDGKAGRDREGGEVGEASIKRWNSAKRCVRPNRAELSVEPYPGRPTSGGDLEPDVELCHTGTERRTETVRLSAREVIVFDLLIPPQIDKVLIYSKPVSMRWGATKLRSFCADTLGSDPQPDTAFLFTNKKQDTLLLYLVCEDGDQTLMKKLDRGAFVVPIAKPGGDSFVSVRRSALPKLFR
jgi:hypothetical protein